MFKIDKFNLHSISVKLSRESQYTTWFSHGLHLLFIHLMIRTSVLWISCCVMYNRGGESRRIAANTYRSFWGCEFVSRILISGINYFFNQQVMVLFSLHFADHSPALSFWSYVGPVIVHNFFRIEFLYSIDFMKYILNMLLKYQNRLCLAIHIALYSYVLTDTPDSEQVCNISHTGTAKGGRKKYEDINSKSK